MYGYGYGGWWMMLMPIVWIVLVGLVVWGVVRLVPGASGDRGGQRRETPQEILDRRFALGEIDADTYTEAKARLVGQR